MIRIAMHNFTHSLHFTIIVRAHIWGKNRRNEKMMLLIWLLYVNGSLEYIECTFRSIFVSVQVHFGICSVVFFLLSLLSSLLLLQFFVEQRGKCVRRINEIHIFTNHHRQTTSTNARIFVVLGLYVTLKYWRFVRLILCFETVFFLFNFFTHITHNLRTPNGSSIFFFSIDKNQKKSLIIGSHYSFSVVLLSMMRIAFYSFSLCWYWRSKPFFLSFLLNYDNHWHWLNNKWQK